MWDFLTEDILCILTYVKCEDEEVDSFFAILHRYKKSPQYIKKAACATNVYSVNVSWWQRL
jgi:hypothetical protein